MEEQMEAVQRMQDYITDHLSEDITLAALANVSYFSPWFFIVSLCSTRI